MKNLEYKGKSVTIVEVLKDKHYKLFIDSSFLNYYDSVEKCEQAAKRHIELFMKGEKE